MRRVVILASVLLLACSGLVPEPTPTAQIPRQQTRHFVIRGAQLGGSCQSAREFEAKGATFTRHDLLGEIDRYGFAEGHSRIALIYCQHDLLCEQNVTMRFANQSDAAASCEAQREDLISRLGLPILDTQSQSGGLPGAVTEHLDPDVSRPTIWRLSESELMLDCPRAPDGEGDWMVSLSHGFDPQVIAAEFDPETTVIIPSHGCPPPP